MPAVRADRGNLRRWAWLPALIALEALGCAFWLAMIPGEAGSALPGGFSGPRLLLLAALFGGAAAAGWVALGLFLGWFCVEKPVGKAIESWKIPAVRTSFLVLGAALISLALMPPYRFGRQTAAYERLLPLVSWGALSWLSLAMAAFFPRLRLWWSGLFSDRSRIRHMRMVVFGLGGLWLAWSVMGLRSAGDVRHWNEGGVPILVWQVAVALLITLAAAPALPRPSEKGQSRRYVITAALLWLTAALLWNLLPLGRSYFISDPVPPNFNAYPVSDAEIYDWGAQFFLIGQGVNNLEYFDKIWYMALLAFARWTGGQDYQAAAAVQTVILALLPAMVFWVGVRLGSAKIGLMAALLVILQEANTILASDFIQVSHARLFLSEFPAALSLAILWVSVSAWARGPRNAWHLPILAGGWLGLAVLVRTTALAVYPIILLWLLLAFKLPRQRWLHAALFSAGLALALLPWTLGGRTPSGRIFLVEKISAVLESRYQDETEGAAPATTLDGRAETSLNWSDWRVFVPGHFLHNLAASFVELPQTMRLEDLEHTLDAPFWRMRDPWTPQPGRILFSILNLAVIGMGVTSALWNVRGDPAGWLLGGFFLAYHAGNAFGRTSGARYLVAVDWILVLFYACGLLWLVQGGRPAEQLSEDIPRDDDLRRKGGARTALAALGVVILGAAPMWMGWLVPRRYQPASAQALLEQIRPDLLAAGIQEEQINGFLQSPGAMVMQGRAVYPKFFYAGSAEFCPLQPKDSLDVDAHHLMLRVFGPQGHVCLRLGQAREPVRLPEQGDVIVAGCQGSNFQMDALAVIYTDPEKQSFFRYPQAQWSCPLPEVICRQDGTCRNSR